MAMVKQGDTGSGRYSRARVAKRQVDQASWEDAEPDDVWRTIQAVTNAGDYIAFSKTRDGGALVLFVKDGGEGLKEYATGAEEVKNLLDRVRASAEDSE